MTINHYLGAFPGPFIGFRFYGKNNPRNNIINQFLPVCLCLIYLWLWTYNQEFGFKSISKNSPPASYFDRRYITFLNMVVNGRCWHAQIFCSLLYCHKIMICSLLCGFTHDYLIYKVIIRLKGANISKIGIICIIDRCRLYLFSVWSVVV